MITGVMLKVLVREPKTTRTNGVKSEGEVKYVGASYAVFCKEYPNIISTDGGWYFFDIVEAMNMFDRLERNGYGKKGHLIMDSVTYFRFGRKRNVEHEHICHVSQYGVNKGKVVY